MISPLVSSSTICRQLALSAGLSDTGFLFAGGGNQAFALRPLARELTRSADCFAFFSGRFLGWFFVEPSTLHLAEDAFPLHLPFQHLESLVDIVIADQYLQEMFPSACFKTGASSLLQGVRDLPEHFDSRKTVDQEFDRWAKTRVVKALVLAFNLCNRPIARKSNPGAKRR